MSRVVLCALLLAFAEDPAASPGEAEFLRVKGDRPRLHAFLRRLPKGGNLHAHLSGEYDPDLEIKLAREKGFYIRVDQGTVGKHGIAGDVAWKIISKSMFDALGDAGREAFEPVDAWIERDPANEAKLRDLLTMQGAEPLGEFFSAIFARKGEVANDPEARDALLRDVLERFRGEAVGYLELRINPVTKPGLDEDLGKVVDAFNREHPADPIEVRFVIGISRGRDTTEAHLAKAFEIAAGDDDGRDRVVGVDLLGLEQAKGAPSDYLDTLAELRRRHPSVKISLHAGESNERDPHVRDSILLGARRIGHGLNLAADPFDTIGLAKRENVLIEVSLHSNRLLYKTPIDAHPFRTYLARGLPVSLNTDDGGIFDTTLTDEFTDAVLAFGLTWGQVRALCENSLRYSFAREADKAAILDHWRARWRACEDKPNP